MTINLREPVLINQTKT